MGRLRFIDKLANWYIIILIVGFLFIATIPKLIGVLAESLSIEYRILILGFSLFFILNAIFSKRINKIQFSPLFLFFIFWTFYSIRVIHDLYLYPIELHSETSTSQYAQFAFGVVLIPSVALLFIIQAYKINIQWILKWFYRILLVTLSVALYYRANSELSGRTAGDVNIGILAFGQYGATLSILSVYCIARDKLNLKSNLFYVFGFIIGFSSIIVSASKSPFLALIAVLLLFSILRYGNFKSAFIIAFGGLLISFYFIEILSVFNDYFNSNFIYRLFYAMEEGDSSRESLVNFAFNEFIENPLFGNAMFIQSGDFTGSYPHNFIVEAFMATGVLGGAIFLGWIVRCLKLAIRVLKTHSEISWIALLFFQYLIFAMFSGSIYSGNMFWSFSVMLIALSSKDIRKPSTMIDYKNKYE